MGVTYIVGRAQTGKTTRLYELAAQSVKNGRKTLILVPEQYALYAEREFMSALGVKCLIGAEVLSFSRLAQRVIAERGPLTRSRITLQGRVMLVKKALSQVSGLTVFEGVADRVGFLEMMAEQISELKRYGISPQALAGAAKETCGVLSKKLADISRIYAETESLMAGRYLDMEDELALLIKKAGESELIRGADIFIDGFETFTTQIKNVLRELLLHSASLTVTFRLDPNSAADAHIFAMEKLYYDGLHALAYELGIDEKFEILTRDCARCNPEIAHIEGNLFALPYKTYNAEPKHVELVEAFSPDVEARRVAARIARLVRGGMRYNDIAVMAGSIEDYGPALKRALRKFGIPFFMDEKRSLAHHPVSTLLCESLTACAKGMPQSCILRIMKTNLSGLTMDEAELLENHMLRCGLTGDMLKRSIDSNEALEKARALLMEPLLTLEKRVKNGAPAETMAEALYDYACAIGLPAQLSSAVSAYAEEGRLQDAAVTAQVWNAAADLLDQAAEILRGINVTPAEFASILEAGFESAEMAIIPTAVDQVLVGDIIRTRAQDMRALFLIGCVDGKFPPHPKERILNDDDIETLLHAGIVAGYPRERADAGYFAIYSAIAKPSEYLWLSYPLADSEGGDQRPSMLITALRRIFPGLKTQTDATADDTEEIATEESAFSALVRRMAANNPLNGVWAGAYAYFAKHPAYSARLEAVKSAMRGRNTVKLSAQTARKLFGDPIYTSVSRIEKYYACPFSHFVRYGLKPEERKEYAVEPADAGTIYHAALDGFVKGAGADIRSLDYEKCEKLMNEAMDKVLADYGEGIFESSAKYAYLARRLKRVGTRSVWAIIEHLKNSDFSPVFTEVSFGGEGSRFPRITVDLPDGRRAYLYGRIDRVDAATIDGEQYLRIIDYKSGSAAFDYTELCYGLKLQLAIYMKALLDYWAAETGQAARPAGMFYFKIDDPMVKTDSEVTEEVERMLRECLKMSGVMLCDAKVVYAMDKSAAGKSDFLPVSFSGGVPKASQSVLDEEKLCGIIGYAHNMAAKAAMEIGRGSADITPAVVRNKSSCRYCDYRCVCGFDPRLNRMIYRRNVKFDEFFAMLESEAMPDA